MLAKKNHYRVFVSDGQAIKEEFRNELLLHKIDFEEGSHDEDKILDFPLVVKSPGISEEDSLLKKLREKGIKIISEIEFGYWFKGNSIIIGITGSNGKTTTTALIYHICRHAGLDCTMVGNIGFSFARQIALEPRDVYVAEISSFQLDDIENFRPDIAVLTNITEDHLDRYDNNFENYIRSKFRIMQNQSSGDVFIYSADDEITNRYLNIYLNETTLLPYSMSKPLPRGAYIRNAEMHIKWNDEELCMSVDDFTIKGKHNQYNTMAACLSATVMDIRKEKIRDAVQNFESLEHRMEYVGTIRGVEFINDSKATNTNSTWYALESIKRPTILILGGVDKGNDYSFMKDLVKEKVKAIICLGSDNRKIHEAFGNEVELMINTDNAKDAVQSAFHMAVKGDVVLLSPACASFDLFKNYEDRGNQFKAAVKDL